MNSPVYLKHLNYVLAPVDRIKEWQAEIIPEEITPQDEVAYWSTKYEPKYKKYLSKRIPII